MCSQNLGFSIDLDLVFSKSSQVSFLENNICVFFKRHVCKRPLFSQAAKSLRASSTKQHVSFIIHQTTSSWFAIHNERHYPPPTPTRTPPLKQSASSTKQHVSFIIHQTTSSWFAIHNERHIPPRTPYLKQSASSTKQHVSSVSTKQHHLGTQFIASTKNAKTHVRFSSRRLKHLIHQKRLLDFLNRNQTSDRQHHKNQKI